jgi:hypothetical protein
VGLGRVCQALAGFGTQATQQSQKLAVEFTHIALTNHQALPGQSRLNFIKLAVFPFVLPTNVGQYIQPVGAVGQAQS